MKLSISIVIPTYNGNDLLEKYLPRVIKYSYGAEITIVDDASTDNSVRWLKENYPDIRVISHTKNRGFSAAVNTGFKNAETDLVLLLNNDVALEKDTIENLARNFMDRDNLFAVGALEKLADKTQRGKSQGEFKRGFLIHSASTSLEFGPTLWVFAASGMFSRSIWNKLSGLDELFAPAYWEDIDIGYRAWKAGYECLFDPSAQVFHQAETTMNRELGWKKQVYGFKNQFLFFWKNITDPSLIVAHILWMPYHLIFTTIKTKGIFLLGFIYALFQLSLVLSQHKKYIDIRTDRAISDIVTSKIS